MHGLEGSGAYTAKMFMCADVAPDFKEDSAVLGGRLRGFIWSRDSDPHKVSVTQVWGLWAGLVVSVGVEASVKSC